MEIENQNPDVIQPEEFYDEDREAQEEDDSQEDQVDQREIFDMIRNLPDPEHPLTLEQLQVVEMTNISIDQNSRVIKVFFTPTIPNCSSANLIGLMIKIRLLRWVSS